MSLLAGLSQQGDSIAAHNADAAAHVHVATFSNADYVFADGVNVAQQIGTLTAARTATLPAANSLARGVRVNVSDLSGSLSPLTPIKVTAAGSDTIGAGTIVYMTIPYDSLWLETDGVSLWSLPSSLQFLNCKSVTTKYPIAPGVVVMSTVASASMSSAYMHYGPAWTLHAPAVLEGLLYEIVTGGGAASTFRIGLYTCDSSMQPVSLVYDSGALDANTVAAATHTIVGGLLLPPGRYIPFWQPSATTSFRVLKGVGEHSFHNPAFSSSPWVHDFAVSRVYAAAPATGLKWDTTIASTTAGAVFVFTGIFA